jgi:hypothetical protein
MTVIKLENIWKEKVALLFRNFPWTDENHEKPHFPDNIIRYSIYFVTLFLELLRQKKFSLWVLANFFVVLPHFYWLDYEN